MKSRMSVSSAPMSVVDFGRGRDSGGLQATAVLSRRRRAASLRTWSAMRRTATWISQPRGLSGTPSRGHCSGGGHQGFLHRVLGGGEVAEPHARPRRAPAARGRAADARNAAVQRRRCHRRSSGGPLITCRTSIGMFIGFAAESGRRGRLGGDRIGTLGALHVDDPLAGEELLGFREHPVRDRLAVLAGPHHLRLRRAWPDLPRTPVRLIPPASW